MFEATRNTKVIPISGQNMKRQSRKRVLNLQRWIVIGCFIWAAYTFFLIQLPSLHKLNVQEQQLNQQLSDLNQKNQQLQDKIKKLNQDTYIGELARSKYNMQSPGDMPLETP
jgi:cell division protein FtsB